MPTTNDAKRELRHMMRELRRRAAVDPRLSEAIGERLDDIAELRQAKTVMLFEPAVGEPDLGSLAERLRKRQATVVAPAAAHDAGHPAAPADVDAVVVPGLAFTRTGDRLGQGGGWYDQFLAGIRPDCVVIGVCFDEQLLDDIPIEQHDIRVHYVVTPSLTVGVEQVRSRSLES